MNDRTSISDDDLECLFKAARSDAIKPAPEKLLMRVVQDANDVVSKQYIRPKAGFWSFVAELGGWPMAGGLATAALCGIGIGLALPAEMTGPGFASLISTQDNDFALMLPDYDFYADEG